jgi:glycosyltransferase involved in cell wall biosynthesis
MKVMHVVESLGGGVFTSVLQIVNALPAQGFEVVLAFDRRPETPADMEARVDPAVRLVPLPMATPISPGRDLLALGRLYRLMRRERPDVVQLHSSKAGALGRAAARFAGVRSVYYSPRGFAFLREDVSAARRGLYRFAERAAARFGGTVVACSHSELEAARTVTKRATVIPNAIDLGPIDSALAQRPKAARDDDRVIVAISGRIAPQRPGRARFMWVGGGDTAPELAEAGIEVTGWLDRDQALGVLASQVDIYLHSSRWEGLPLAVLEAMALSKPVVATDVIGNRDAVQAGETGFLANDAEALAGHVVRLIDDAALRASVGAAGRSRVEERFALPLLVERFTRLYRGEDTGVDGA